MSGIFFILLAAAGYSTVALFGRWIFDHHLPMYTVLTWRFGGAALLLGLLNRFWGGVKTPREKKIPCFLMGMVADTLQTSFFFFSVARVGASLAALLLYTFPLFVFLIQRFFFQQPATKIQWISLSISLLGCLLIINPFQENAVPPKDGMGILFGLGAGLTYAFYLCFGAHFTKNISPLSSASLLTTGAFFSFALVSFLQGNLATPSGSSEWLLAILLILIGTVLPLLCLVKGMQLLGATQTSLLFTVEPIITIVFAILFFGESLSFLKAMGSLCILSSAVLVQKKKKSVPIPDPLEG